MKPEIEKVLFDGHCCSGEMIHMRKINTCKAGNCDDEDCPFNTLEAGTDENVFVHDLKGKYYPGFIKYFHSSYKDSMSQALKNPEKSLEARIQGNKLFAKKNHNVQVHEQIWKLYSKSIAFAPVDSKELVLAYECRSNLLLHLQKYKECIKDIDRALAITGFDLLKVKLLCRKITCFTAINKDAIEKENLWVSIKSHFEKVDGALKDDKILKMVKQARMDSCSPSDEQIEEDSETLFPESDVMYANKKDSFLIAKRDFVPGEIVAMVKPVITSVNPDKFHAYCSHCCSFMWAGIPCEECALCLYCSEECRTEAWEMYHNMECKILPHINFDNLAYYMFQTTIKALFIGLKEFGSFAKLKETVKNLDKMKLMYNMEFTESVFSNFYLNSRKLNPGFCSITRDSKHTCFLFAYLSQIFQIFEKDIKSMKGSELARDKELVSYGLILMKIYSSSGLARTLRDSQLEESKISKCKEEEYRKSKRSNFQGAVYDHFKGMIPKNCNPNASVCHLKNGKLVYYCTQPIKKTDKICVCSHTEFYKGRVASFSMHPNDLINLGQFCTCKICAKQWPNMEKMFGRFKQRSSKFETKASKIVKKYLERNNMKINRVEDENCVSSESEFQELAKDVNQVHEDCGQPSFASSFMSSILCAAFVKLYGMTQFESYIPQDC